VATEGTFVLADIGGYTSFLSGVGLQHAKEATEHLLNCIVKANEAPWKVGNVMGDCVFFYSPKREPPEQTYGRVRSLYEAFREAQMDIASGSTCRCGACDRTQELSLKFVVHAGEYDVQNIGGRKELVGKDIVVATRLLKNSVPVREYLIATSPVASVAEASGTTALKGSDDLEGIGRVEYAYVDLKPVHDAWVESREFYLSEEDSKLTVSVEIDAPVAAVWDAMCDLDKVRIWAVTLDALTPIQGDPGEFGGVHTCLHGAQEAVHMTLGVDHQQHRVTERLWIAPRLLDETYTTREAVPLSGGGTRAATHFTYRLKMPVVSSLLLWLFGRSMKTNIKKDMAGLKEFCETGKVAAREKAGVS
jgi:hypothetical protein